MPKKKTPSKLCIRCNRILPLEKFSANRLWASQQYRDAWCTECTREFCKDEETVKRYCFENNRAFKEKAWEAAKKKAAYDLNNNKVYLNPMTPPEKKKEEETLAQARAFLVIKNNAYAYEYVENIHVADSTRDEVVHEFTDERNKPYYDKVWQGWFTPEQVEWMNEKYAQYSEDFVLDNINLQDYARKVIKASLNADLAEDRMRRGQGSPDEYMKAQKIFDDLSKSSNFAACRRKPGESTGMGSLGEIILKLETQGYLDENPYTFPDDDIDKVIQAYQYTLESVGMKLH